VKSKNIQSKMEEKGRIPPLPSGVVIKRLHHSNTNCYFAKIKQIKNYLRWDINTTQ
jgi:hypothetical protein